MLKEDIKIRVLENAFRKTLENLEKDVRSTFHQLEYSLVFLHILPHKTESWFLFLT